MGRTSDTAAAIELARDASVALRPETALSSLKGIGPARAAALRAAGVTTVLDLLLWLPRRHLDRLAPTSFDRLPEQGAAAVVARVKSLRVSRRGPRSLTRVVLEQGERRLEALFFNQPHLQSAFPRGAEVFVQGRLVTKDGVTRLAASWHERLSAPDGESLPEESTPGAVKIPVYELPEGVPPRVVRRLIAQLLPRILPSLTDWRATFAPAAPMARDVVELVPLAEAIAELHFPTDVTWLERARRRLAYEELFARVLPLESRRAALETRRKPRVVPVESSRIERLAAALPFAMTRAQRRALADIAKDLARPAPMHRLLHGEVGSGKTAVALVALALVADAGFTGALLAPTEILARQHEAAARRVFSGFDIDVLRVSASLAAAEKKEALARLSAARGRLVVVGTHALFGGDVRIGNLALAVVDEQHRFGVTQRARLRDKGELVDLLVMTATPIPRTLALTIYGDLDLSMIDELPPGRAKVETRRVSRRDFPLIAESIAREARDGGRVYVVCPVVEGSAGDDREAAVRLAKKLAARFCGAPRVALAHGRLSPASNASAIEDFRAGRAPVLVSTVVVEVGVDVPEATTMVVMDADRFGLAQLHQLRGRVGRGGRPGRCILVASGEAEEVAARLDVLVRETSGFAIADEDLRLRGAGQVFGSRQHGAFDFVHADPLRDVDLLALARADARFAVESGRAESVLAALPRFPSFARAAAGTEIGPG